MSGRLILAGNVIADLVIEVPALPERGGDVIGTRTELTAGGGFNTLVAARRLGTEAVFAGLHGTARTATSYARRSPPNTSERCCPPVRTATPASPWPWSTAAANVPSSPASGSTRS
ncbi:hypothetical protein [Streptomyces scopuliridis]|uniref:hypothetical protein n=1 Tax=Streptomyces scopuliridis TaxID=452529 RepID=UPI00369E138A